jgi:hypothetical protein
MRLTYLKCFTHLSHLSYIFNYTTFGIWGALMAGGEATLLASHIKSKESKEILAGQIKGWVFV